MVKLHFLILIRAHNDSDISALSASKSIWYGGKWDNGSHAGMFDLNLDNSASFSHTNVGSILQ